MISHTPEERLTLVEALRHHAAMMLAAEVRPKVREMLSDAMTLMSDAADRLELYEAERSSYHEAIGVIFPAIGWKSGGLGAAAIELVERLKDAQHAVSSEKEDQLEAQPGSEASAKANPAGRGSLPAASTNPQFDKDYRPCTCHHDDAPVPCPRKYALTECLKESAKYWQAQAAKLAADVSELTAQLDAKPSSMSLPSELNEYEEPLRELCFDYRNADTMHAENYFQRIVRWVRMHAVRNVLRAEHSARVEPLICYTPCKAHEGMSWTMTLNSGYHQPAITKCPICEPPK